MIRKVNFSTAPSGSMAFLAPPLEPRLPPTRPRDFFTKITDVRRLVNVYLVSSFHIFHVHKSKTSEKSNTNDWNNILTKQRGKQVKTLWSLLTLTRETTYFRNDTAWYFQWFYCFIVFHVIIKSIRLMLQTHCTS